MSSLVRALYDFAGEPNTSEISLSSGEVLTVTRTDVGEGWWEGKNPQGLIGLFPAAYVEVLSAAEVAQLSVVATRQASPVAATANTATETPPPRYDQTAEDDGQDDWDDDWDDDNDTYSEIGPASAAISNNNRKQSSNYSHPKATSYAEMHLPPTPTDDTISISASSGYQNSSTIKKSGMFSKSGDSYIFGTVNIPVPENERAVVVHVDNVYYWKPNGQNYTVKVASPKKETKFKGMKSYIAYQLTPSFNGISVFRRYKHFDWLHERLEDKFCVIPIPPLPDKQISGRYEEQFIEHRRVQLQEFVDWMCRHPILSTCDVWMHFLTCTDEKRWKTGKRMAEKDPLVGISYCNAVFPPEKQLLHSFVDVQIESYSIFVPSMDNAIKNLLSVSNEQTKRCQLQWKKDYQRIGECFSELARSLEVDERRVTTSSSLSTSVGRTAGLFISIGQLFGEQPKNDWIPFSDRLHIYRGILGSFPDMLSTHKSAQQKRKDCERLTAENKMGNAQLSDVVRRTDIISYAVLAEMSHFRAERDTHLKNTIHNLIDAQIKFFQDVIVKLQSAQKQFE